MKKRRHKRPDLWAGRREASFAANKVLADKLAKRRGGKCLSGPRRKNDKWQWKCKVPTHKSWYANLFQIAGTGKRKGSWCKACTGDSWVNRRKTSFEKNKILADKLARERGGKCLSGPQRKHDKWQWKCIKTDHKSWWATLAQVDGCGERAGSWCPRCAGKDVPEKVYRDWAKRFGGKLIQQAKRTIDISIWWCSNHDDQFERSLSSMQTTDSFCPDCNVSLGERKCKAAMEQLFGVKFVKKRFDQLKGIGGKALEIDVFNEDLKLGLEHQGAHHFMKKKYFGEHRFDSVQEHDRRKREFCAASDITLIEIRQVGEKTPDNKLKETIRAALLEQNFPIPKRFDEVQLTLDAAALPSLQEDKWQEAKAEAQRRGWRVVSKKYLGSLTRHDFVCDQGHPVKLKPSYLLQGQGCSFCDTKPVVLDDGQCFASLKEAAEKLEASVSAVSSAILKHGRVKGRRATTVDHKKLQALQSQSGLLRTKAIANLFLKLPVRPKVGESNGKPVLLGDGRMFPSAYEAARVVGVDKDSALAAAKRPKGKINGIRIAQITQKQQKSFEQNPSLIEEFWDNRPLGPRRFMTRRRGVLTSLKEVFDGVREASEALGVKEQRICDYARREKELKGRRLWYVSQDELALLRDKKLKPAELLKKKRIEGHAPQIFGRRKHG